MVYFKTLVKYGTVNITVASPNTTTFGYSLTTVNNTFTNTCPFVVNYLNDLPTDGGIPATTNSIVAGCYISKPPTTSLNTVFHNIQNDYSLYYIFKIKYFIYNFYYLKPFFSQNIISFLTYNALCVSLCFLHQYYSFC